MVTFSFAPNFLSALRMAASCADVASTRYWLGAVCLKFHRNYLTICGTDGKQLCAIDGIEYRSDYKPETEFDVLITCTDIKKALSQKATGTATLSLHFMNPDRLCTDPTLADSFTLSFVNGSKKTVSESAQICQGRFPRFEDIIPDKGQSTARIMASAYRMADFLKPSPIRSLSLNRSATLSRTETAVIHTGANKATKRPEPKNRFEYEGHIETAYNVEMLHKFVSQIEDETLTTWTFSDGDSPVLCEFSECGFDARYVAMPTKS